MRFDLITIFPEAFSSYLSSSILKRAQEKGLIRVYFHNPRSFTRDKHRTVDGKPYGGGAGMVMMGEPILKAYEQARRQTKNKKLRTKVSILSAKGKPFTQKTAYNWAQRYNHFVFISGRYEGIDERVRAILKAEEISIGPYVLTDGDVAAMVIVSTIARLIPGVIRLESLQEESHWSILLEQEQTAREGLEYPHYTRPEILVYKGKKHRVPKVLLSGNHKKIAAWREAHRRASPR